MCLLTAHYFPGLLLHHVLLKEKKIKSGALLSPHPCPHQQNAVWIPTLLRTLGVRINVPCRYVCCINIWTWH